jgi:hypothetical protein
MTKEKFIELVSKIHLTEEDEFLAAFNSPELLWNNLLERLFKEKSKNPPTRIEIINQLQEEAGLDYQRCFKILKKFDFNMDNARNYLAKTIPSQYKHLNNALNITTEESMIDKDTVIKLSQETKVNLMECRKILTKFNGDFEKSKDYLLTNWKKDMQNKGCLF